jgi:acetyl esterase/lipase
MEGVSVSPRAGPGDNVILYCHGGGFQIGSTTSHLGLMARLAEAAAARVIGFNYRLAPEHRFPAAVEDALAAYDWLLDKGHPATRIAVAGDSAGAGLALTIALRAAERGRPAPLCLALLSPWLDLSLRGQSYVSRAGVDIFSKPEQLRAMARTYVGRGQPLDDPLVSPINADLQSLSPTLIHAGDFDITLDDAKLFTQRATRAGAEVTLEIWDEMYHHFQVFEELPEAQASVQKIGAYIRARWPSLDF